MGDLFHIDPARRVPAAQIIEEIKISRGRGAALRRGDPYAPDVRVLSEVFVDGRGRRFEKGQDAVASPPVGQYVTSAFADKRDWVGE